MDHHVAYSVGAALAQLGDVNASLRWLTRAADTGFPSYPWFERDSLLDPLRKHPQLATPSCDHACLSRAMTDFVNAMTSRTFGSVRLSDSAEIRETAGVLPLEGTAWRQVKSVRSVMTFADVVTGNAVSRAGVELLDGKAGYISTRLKVGPADRITDVELSVDTSPASSPLTSGTLTRASARCCRQING